MRSALGRGRCGDERRRALVNQVLHVPLFHALGNIHDISPRARCSMLFVLQADVMSAVDAVLSISQSSTHEPCPNTYLEHVRDKVCFRLINPP